MSEKFNSLRKALRVGAKPQFSTILKMLKALDLNLKVFAASEAVYMNEELASKVQKRAKDFDSGIVEGLNSDDVIAKAIVASKE